MAVLVAAGCREGKGDGETDTCDRAAYSATIGSNIAAVLFPAELDIRILGPDSLATTDHRPERLNVELDENGIITALTCG